MNIFQYWAQKAPKRPKMPSPGKNRGNPPKMCPKHPQKGRQNVTLQPLKRAQKGPQKPRPPRGGQKGAKKGQKRLFFGPIPKIQKNEKSAQISSKVPKKALKTGILSFYFNSPAGRNRFLTFIYSWF